MVPAGQPREDEEATVIAPSDPAHERAGIAEGGGDRNPSPPSGHTEETASEPPPDHPKPKTAHERVAEIPGLHHDAWDNIRRRAPDDATR